MSRFAMRSIGLTLLMASLAPAATLHWTGSGGDTLWDNPANWETGKVPTAGDEAYIDVPAALAPNGPVIQEGMEAEVLGLACEVAGEPTMTMTGGILDVADWIWWGDGANCHGTFYMSGGTITTGSEFELGWGGGEGTWFMTGGTINAMELVIPTSSGRAGQLYLHGGIVNVGSDGLSMTETGLIDIAGGTLTLEGDWRETIQELISNSRITAYDSTGTFEVDYNLRNEGLTTVTAIAPVTEKAYKPVTPTDGEVDVYRDTDLVWVPGLYAVGHDLYLGTVLDEVNNASRANPLDVLIAQDVDANTFDPATHLELGQTYYWRIDEVNGTPDNTIFKGDVWSFTTEPLAYRIENITATSNATSDADQGPENTVNGSGLNAADEHSNLASDMWLGTVDEGTAAWIQFEFDRVYQLHAVDVWNHNGEFETVLGFGFKDTTIEYSTDGAAWTTLDNVELAQGTGTSDYTHDTPVDLAGVAAKFVRLTANAGWGPRSQYGLSEVRFWQIPAQARSPQPTLGQRGAHPQGTLTWRAGREAASHEVYLSDDAQAVTEGTALITTTDQTRYDPTSLDLLLGWTYYWKIDEVNATETPSVWEGDLWSFVTRDYLVLDDFERYTNEAGGRIYESWEDGWINQSGSTVGYFEAPFAETIIVHSGRQSMPLLYENTGGIAYSEADYVSLPVPDWTQAGATTLTLYFQGDPDNAAGQLYIKIDDVRVDYDGNPQNLAEASWTQWNIDLPATGADLSSVTVLRIGVEGSGSGILFIDDIRLYRVAPM